MDITSKDFKEREEKTTLEGCPFCGFIGPTIWVHGHEQCQKCLKNIFPCCEGCHAINQFSN